MARPREFDPEAATDAALRAFWERGFEATSTADLVEATGVSRSSLYATFGSKHGLFLATLDRYLAGGGRRSALGPLLEPGADVEALAGFFRGLVETARSAPEGGPLGCYCVTTAVELASRDPEVAARAREYRAGLHRALAGALQASADHGTLRPDVDVEIAATTLATLVIGLLASLRMGAGTDEAETAARAATAFLASLEA